MIELLTAIKSKVNAMPALSSLVGRVYLSGLPRDISVGDGPFARVSVLPVGTVDHAYSKPAFQDHYMIQFSVWSNSATSAGSLVDSLSTAFNGVTLTLSSNRNTHSFRKSPPSILKEPDDAKGNPVFQAAATFEFWVQTA